MRSFRRRWLIAGSLLAALLIAAGTVALGKVKRYPDKPVYISVHAELITASDDRDPSRARFGALEFRGGLDLTSKDQRFGGISALHLAADGRRFLALTDRSAWLEGSVVYKQARPACLADLEMTPALAWDGKPLAATAGTTPSR